MGLRQRLADAIYPQRKLVRQTTSNAINVTALCSAYENLFAQLRPLIDEMEIVRPYGVGRNGARLADNRTQALVQLLSPNYDMDFTDFMDTALSVWLTEEELNIRVMRSGKRVKGYVILPVGSRVRLANGRSYFQYWGDEGVEKVDEDEVMTLRFSRNPRDFGKGVSPAGSVFTWSQIDDLFAQYQKAFFENGAVPATITFITASTKERYEAERNKLERGFGGARNKNKTLYVWRQLLATGESKDQVEVKTIQGNNSTLAIEQLMKVINDKLNKAIGVSNFILGDDSSAKYDNAELSDRQFTKRRVYPALRRFWGQFQHELDRILGGLGYAIQFDLEIPELTDRLKTRAEIAKTNTETLRSLIEGGSMPSAARIALGLDEEWQSVADGLYKQHLADRAASEIVARAENAVEALKTSDSHRLKELSAHHCCHSDDSIIVDSLTEQERKFYEVLSLVLQQAAGANIENYSDEWIMEQIHALEVAYGDEGANQSAEAIAKQVVNSQTSAEIRAVLDGGGFHVSEAYETRMRERASMLVNSFTGETRDAVAEILNSNETMTQNQLRAKLTEALTTGVSDESLLQKLINRAATIARNETVYAFRSGSYDNDMYMSDKYGLELEYEWSAYLDNKTCPICRELNGKRVKLGEAFPSEVEYDGKAYAYEQSTWNDNGKIAQAHVNCRCTAIPRVVGTKGASNAN